VAVQTFSPARFARRVAKWFCCCLAFYIAISVFVHLAHKASVDPNSLEWTRSFKAYSSSQIDRQKYVPAVDAIDDFFSNNPEESCACSADVGLNWHHFAVRHTEERARHFINPTVYPSKLNAEGETVPQETVRRTEFAVHCHNHENKQPFPVDKFTPLRDRDLETMEEMAARNRVVRRKRSSVSGGLGGFLWWAHTATQRLITVETGDVPNVLKESDHAEKHTRLVKRHTHIIVTAFDAQTGDFKKTSLFGEDAFCAQMFYDIQNGDWPCDVM
jgi:hypothetical protein